MEAMASEAHYGYRLLLMVLILGVNGFFAAAEAALVSVRPSRLKAMAEDGVKGAHAALSLVGNMERLLSVGQVGLTLASLALGWLGEETLYELLKTTLTPFAPDLVRPALGVVSFVTAFVIMTYLHVVLGEVVPKNVAIDKADRMAVIVAPVLLVFYKVAEPFVWVIERSAALLSDLLGVRGTQHGGGHSAEELKYIISSSQTAGHLTEFEEGAIHNLIEMKDVAVREVMTPRNSVEMVNVEADIDEVLRQMSESRYSRLPVYEGSRENIIGIVHVKDVLEFWTERRQSNRKRKGVDRFDLRRILRKAPVVPETKPLSQLMDDLRRAQSHVALVVDEFGTIVGLVSMEDAMEQVFGEIEDEFDIRAHAETRDEEEALSVEGTMSIRDLEAQYGIELPEDSGFETLAGFVMFKLGRIPQVGDVVEEGERRYLVEEMDFNRVGRVRVERLNEGGHG
jgi:putative hemolysin